MRIQIAVIAVLLMGGCSKAPEPESESFSIPTHGSDITACQQMPQLVRDIEARILTPAELRERVKVIYDEANVTPNSLVALLAVDAASDVKAFAALVRHCTEVLE